MFTHPLSASFDSTFSSTPANLNSGSSRTLHKATAWQTTKSRGPRPSHAGTYAGDKRFFVSPPPAGRKITAGFSFMQRIGKSASIDVWFPEILREALQDLCAAGREPGPENFPAEWAAIRQFELLQESGNYKIYDMNATHLTRTFSDLARSMRAGGYRLTVATLGSYEATTDSDELEILDRRLQDRISHLIHMLYLEEESAGINADLDDMLRKGAWDYRTALPHVGATLGARALFRPSGATSSRSDHKHKLAEDFFAILGLLPQKHLVHDTAVGLQLPESIAENEWIYLAKGEDTLRAFNSLLSDLFRPFDGISLSGLHEREDARSEIRASMQHMRGYGDRLTPETAQFYGDLAQFARG